MENQDNIKNQNKGEMKVSIKISHIQIALIVILFGLLIYGFVNSSSPIVSTGGVIKTVSASKIMPAGTPEVYGEELKIKYDDVSSSNPKLADETIRRLGNIDRSETLEGKNLERYINVLYKLEDGLSCEYCCGARAIIFGDGQPACGCAHSYAMRGVAKYLIKFHGNEFTDEEILNEVGKWKVLFFPDIMENKAKILEANGIDSTNYINLASNKYRGIEKGQQTQGGQMVGGC